MLSHANNICSYVSSFLSQKEHKLLVTKPNLCKCLLVYIQYYIAAYTEILLTYYLEKHSLDEKKNYDVLFRKVI